MTDEKPPTGWDEKAQQPATLDEKALVGEVNSKFDQWRQDRRSHEIQWFLNAAFLRGNQYIEYSIPEQRLRLNPTPSHRVRLVVNRILPKFRARIAKFLKQRPQPIIIPASTDRQDKLNARFTQKALDYIWRKLRLEIKYKDALTLAGTMGKAFWWFYWDPTKTARVQTEGPLGQPQVADAVLGDVCVETGSAFEVLVADQSASRIADQPEIMRAKVREVADLKQRYKDKAELIKADTNLHEIFHYERQIATLNPRGQSGFAMSEKRQGEAQHVLVKELFTKPCGKYPHGRHVVVAGDTLLKSEEQLPYGFDGENPYPCVEFADVTTAGQFWPTTIVEQLIPLQKEYNLVRSKIAEQQRLMSFPKLLAAKQHQIPNGAWTSEPGEFVEYIAIPGIPPPQPWHPPNIAADSWKNLELLRQEFEDLPQIYAASEGQVGESTSGFQTNLLQEASESVHGPDVRAHEMAVEEASFKLRKLMKQGYVVPRLMAIAGKNYENEVFEFSADAIDEYADIVVQAGSSLPMLKGAKIQSVMELWNAGILGKQDDPEVQRRTLGLLEMGEFEGAMEVARRDEELARLENTQIGEGQPLSPPMFYHNHEIHYSVHTDELKSPESHGWPEEQRKELLVHVLQHFRYINHPAAFQLSQELSLAGAVPPPPMMGPPQQGPPGPPAEMPPPPAMAPPPQQAPPTPAQ